MQFGFILVLLSASAAAEVVSLGAVLPFLGMLAAPDVVVQRPMTRRFLELFGPMATDDLILLLSVAFVGAAMIAGALRLAVQWVSTRLVYACSADVGAEMYRRTLYQAYEVHISRNGSEVISGLREKVDVAMFSVVFPAVLAFSASVTLVAVTVVLIVINPAVCLSSLLAFGVCYIAIATVTRRRLRANSRLVAREQTQVLKALQEALGGIRDVLLDGTQNFYCEAYRKADRPLRLAQGSNAFLAQCPRSILETIGILLIAGLAYSLTRHRGTFAAALPMLGALALGAQRMLPALQQSFQGWAGVVGNMASLEEVVRLLEQELPVGFSESAPPPIPFEHSIQFNSVRFRYRTGREWVLDRFDLTIPQGVRVGVIGRTGSGKSTMLDILMGLVTPTEGELLVDRLPIRDETVRAWQQQIAHVPQSIFLADATIAENIAFGLPPAAIDMKRVKEAARKAQLAEHIENQRDGYLSIVGERGVRLSGGQRQRIGIARALYKNASVLVFDEATSALDYQTEDSVMDAIRDLGRDLTILVVAHRLPTLRFCDLIVEIENGRVSRHGSYDQIVGLGERASGGVRHA